MVERLIGRALEITAVSLLVYLVLSNAFGFSSIVDSLGKVYIQGVTALQGRRA